MTKLVRVCSNDRCVAQFNRRMNDAVNVRGSFGRKGAPFEFNLRDCYRWCEAMLSDESVDPGRYLGLIFLQRLRTSADRRQASQLYEEIFKLPVRGCPSPKVCCRYIVHRR